MGAQESRTRHNEEEPAVQDYYAILQVSESADQDEIKASIPLLFSNYHSPPDRKRFENKP